MASLDFEIEKQKFRDYWNENHETLEQGKDAFVAIIRSLLTDDFDVSTVFGRIKEREEAIKKFCLKYQDDLEKENVAYEIKDHITDLIGLRVVCLYEADVVKIKDVLSNEFDVIEVTDKIKDVEAKEDSFGYKGLHVDLKLRAPRIGMKEYQRYSDLRFEVQIRTIVQDAWSVLDHKIKYKKSIPHHIKRRINTLAALFELADREFYSIRNETVEGQEIARKSLEKPSNTEPLNVFSFLAIVEEKFHGYRFLSYKVDGFVSEILSYGVITQQEFKKIIDDEFKSSAAYKAYLGKDAEIVHAINPYTQIRHMLYRYNAQKYDRILHNKQRREFEQWLKKMKVVQDNEKKKAG